jgi:AcrR family transcriptional regulator
MAQAQTPADTAPVQKSSGTEKAILEAAIVLFAEKGFSATTTRQIAQAAGVNEVTLFRHFRSKQELFHKILEEIKRLYPPLIEERQAEAADPQQIITDFCRFTLRRMVQAPHLVRLMLYAMLDEVHELREHLIEKRVESYFEIVKSALARLQRTGHCPLQGNAEELARLLLSQVFGLGLMRLCRLERFEIVDEEKLAQQIASQFLLAAGVYPIPPPARS